MQYAPIERECDLWTVKYHISLDIAAGLEVVHSLVLVHGDVKPEIS